MKTLKSVLLTSLAIAWCALPTCAQEYVPTPENMASRKAFSEARFGIFIHWGLYSLFGQGEWYMTNQDIDCHEYAKAANAFYPHSFDAEQWVSAIKNSGAKYITFTSRHHEGFSMWDTKQSDYNIMHTPYGRDVVRQLADECQRQGMRLHLYYSHLDWTREDYPLGRTGLGTKRLHASKQGNWTLSPSTGSLRNSTASSTTCSPLASLAITTTRHLSQARTYKSSSATFRARIQRGSPGRVLAACRSRPARR